MKLARGVLAKQPPSIDLYGDVASIDDPAAIKSELETLVNDSYKSWIKAGRKRTWTVTDNSQILAISGDMFESVVKQLRQIAGNRGISIRIGKPLASPDTLLYVPILALDKPVPRPKPQSVESFNLSNNDWSLILQALDYVSQRATNDHALAEINNLAGRIESAMHRESPNADIPQLEA